MGYFYAGVFIGSVFVLAKWPFSKTMIAVSLFWVVVQTVFIIVLRKKMPLKGFIQFLIEAALMLIISVFQIVIY